MRSSKLPLVVKMMGLDPDNSMVSYEEYDSENCSQNKLNRGNVDTSMHVKGGTSDCSSPLNNLQRGKLGS